MHRICPNAANRCGERGEKMTPLVLLLVFNAGTLMGFVLHSLLDGAHREDAAKERVLLETTPSFRDDLLMPIMQPKHRHLH
jgi:hypothetical protein